MKYQTIDGPYQIHVTLSQIFRFPSLSPAKCSGAGHYLHGTRFGIRQRDGDHGGGKQLDGGGDGLCTVHAGLRVPAFYLITCLHLTDALGGACHLNKRFRHKAAQAGFCNVLCFLY